MSKEEVQNLSPDILMETRIGFIQKYGVKGVLVLGLSLAAPYAGSMIDSYMNKSLVLAVRREIQPLKTEVHEVETLVIRCRGGIKALSSSDIYYIAKMAVAKQSIDKIAEIHMVLTRYGKNKIRNKYRIKKKIKEILYRNSSIYITDLNRYQHRGIGLVGDYIQHTFPMKSFLDGVYSLVFTKASNSVIEDDIMLYMLEEQKTFFDTMLAKMKKAEE